MDYTKGSVVTETLSSGMIAGIVVGGVLFLIVLVAVIVYCVYAYRRKKDEKQSYAHSMSTLLPTG